jgi:hypothetical protein
MVEWLYCISVLFKIWLRSVSCCCCYIVCNYCLKFDRGMVCNVMVVILCFITVKSLIEEWFIVFLLYCQPLFFKVWQRSGSCCCCYIVYYYCLRFNRGVVHVVVVGYIVYHYSFRFDRGVGDVVVVILCTITI